MKIIIVTIIVCLAVQVLLQGPKLKPRGWPLPHTDFNAVKETEFHLFTRSNPTESIKLEKGGEIPGEFGRNKPTKLIIHGFLNNRESPVATDITAAYLKNFDVNVIVLDWGKGANTWLLNYDVAAGRTREVGIVGANFLMWLLENDPKMWDQLTVVGHSLGAHTAGFIGKNLLDGKKIGRIVGLDPAGPMFEGNHIADRLHKTDARYVEAIHTNCGGLGIKERVGTSDFYPNSGYFQPGCGYTQAEYFGQLITYPISQQLQEKLTKFNQKSHSRVIDLFVESLSNNQFQAISCDDNTAFNKFHLIQHAKFCPMRGSTAYFGGDPGNTFKFDVYGVYHFHTNEVAPYGKGIYWKSALKAGIQQTLGNGNK